MKVKAAVARSHEDTLRLEGLTLAEAEAGEILVKLIACGVAQVDLDAIDGRLAMPLPFVPGSEGAGIVERVGRQVTHLAPGDAVVIGFDYCGRCEACEAGRPRACHAFDRHNLAGPGPDGRAAFTGPEGNVNGRFFGQSAFATHAVCRASRAIKLAKGSPLEVLACLGGEVLIGAGVVLDGFRLHEGSSLVVSGADAVGLAAVMAARAAGAETIVVAEADERRRALASELGANAVHIDENLEQLVRSLNADGANFALETTGVPRARQACLASLAAGGTCAVVGPFDPGLVGVEDSRRLVAAEDYVQPATLVPRLAALHARGDLPLEQLIDFFSFEHVNDALEALRNGTVAKPVLRFSIGAFGDLDRARIEGASEDVPGLAPADAGSPLVRT